MTRIFLVETETNDQREPFATDFETTDLEEALTRIRTIWTRDPAHTARARISARDLINISPDFPGS